MVGLILQRSLDGSHGRADGCREHLVAALRVDTMHSLMHRKHPSTRTCDGWGACPTFRSSSNRPYFQGTASSSLHRAFCASRLTIRRPSSMGRPRPPVAAVKFEVNPRIKRKVNRRASAMAPPICDPSRRVWRTFRARGWRLSCVCASPRPSTSQEKTCTPRWRWEAARDATWRRPGRRN